MNISKRKRESAALAEFSKPATKFEAIDLSIARFIPKGMTRAFRNTRYTVMIYDDIQTTKGAAIQALIQNHKNLPIQNHWSEIQKIKNDIFGEEAMAIEYYPAESELINHHNIYWIWIFPDGVLPKRVI